MSTASPSDVISQAKIDGVQARILEKAIVEGIRSPENFPELSDLKTAFGKVSDFLSLALGELTLPGDGESGPGSNTDGIRLLSDGIATASGIAGILHSAVAKAAKPSDQRHTAVVDRDKKSEVDGGTDCSLVALDIIDCHGLNSQQAELIRDAISNGIPHPDECPYLQVVLSYLSRAAETIGDIYWGLDDFRTRERFDDGRLKVDDPDRDGISLLFNATDLLLSLVSTLRIAIGETLGQPGYGSYASEPSSGYDGAADQMLGTLARVYDIARKHRHEWTLLSWEDIERRCRGLTDAEDIRASILSLAQERVHSFVDDMYVFAPDFVTSDTFRIEADTAVGELEYWVSPRYTASILYDRDGRCMVIRLDFVDQTPTRWFLSSRARRCHLKEMNFPSDDTAEKVMGGVDIETVPAFIISSLLVDAFHLHVRTMWENAAKSEQLYLNELLQRAVDVVGETARFDCPPSCPVCTCELKYTGSHLTVSFTIPASFSISIPVHDR